MKKTLFFITNLLLISQLSYSQSVTIVPTNPLNPTKGTMDFNNATNQLQYWNSAAWIPITNAASGTGWALSGNDISNINTGNVGIGTGVPQTKLHIVPFGAGSIFLGRDKFAGGYTGLEMGISSLSGGYSTIQSTSASGSTYGNLFLNPFGGNVAIGNQFPTAKLVVAGNSNGNGENTATFLNPYIGMNQSYIHYGTKGDWFIRSAATAGKVIIQDMPNAGNVGIGTSTPSATFNVAVGKTVLFGADTSGNGNKLIWYANKGAFRCGGIDEGGYGNTDFTLWDNINVGKYSTALGHNTTASGYSSTSMGQQSIASGDFSTAIGFAGAYGFGSTAIGFATANGISSTAMGYNTTASGNASMALGINANTNNQLNSFCIAGSPGLNNSLITSNTVANQMMMRFDNYTFYVAGTNNYAYLIPASNGWAYTSDRNRKENFEELNGETVLKKISKIPFYSWNFKDKTVKEYRHYGIMAQDFYQNFGKDNHGVIGNDTTVSALDLLGVAYSGIKALEKRTEDLQIQNEEFRSKNNDLGIKNEEFRIKNEKLEARLENIEKMLMVKKEN